MLWWLFLLIFAVMMGTVLASVLAYVAIDYLGHFDAYEEEVSDEHYYKR